MSFQNKSILMSRDYGSMANGEMDYDTSNRIEQKRPHNCSMDAFELELFSNKKQAVDCGSNRPTSGAANTGISSLGSLAGGIGERPFGPHPVRSSNFEDKNVSFFVNGDLNVGNKDFVDQVGNNSSVCLSASCDVEDPLFLNTVVRKVKVNQLVSENHLSEVLGTSYNPGDKMMSPVFHQAVSGVSLAPTYSTGDVSAISLDPAFYKADENFTSMGHDSNRRDGNFMLMGHQYNATDNNLLSIGQVFDKKNYNFVSIGEQCEKENNRLMATGPNYYKGHEDFISLDAFYNKASEGFLSAAPTYDKGGVDIRSMTSVHAQQDATVVSLGTVFNSGNSNIQSMNLNHNNETGTTISFEGFEDNPNETDPSGRLISNDDLLLNQSSARSSQEIGEEGSVFPKTSAISASNPRTGNGPKNKEQKTTKKVSSNNFPANVKSLLSTGILDGVPVKYISWSREKNLRGVVNGTGYLCGCNDCKLSKAINAYEFERHAGCKTKHPNNHIYFENGKTIYAVVQELKSTSQDVLFEAMENVTGSPVNQKNFRAWKASYQAATRELQRIYGKDEVAVVS